MIARRGLLGLLMGSPLIAKEVLGQAVSGSTLGSSAGYPEPYNEPVDPIRQAYEKLRRRHRDKFDRKQRSPEYMPAHIASKRSWSATFKNHVWAKEVEAHEEQWDWDMNDPDMMRKLLALAEKHG